MNINSKPWTGSLNIKIMEEITDDLICRYLNGETTKQENLQIGEAILFNPEVAKNAIKVLRKLRGITEDFGNNEVEPLPVSDDLICNFAIGKTTVEETKQLLNAAMQNHKIAVNVVTCFNTARIAKGFSKEKLESLVSLFGKLVWQIKGVVKIPFCKRNNIVI